MQLNSRILPLLRKGIRYDLTMNGKMNFDDKLHCSFDSADKI